MRQGIASGLGAAAASGTVSLILFVPSVDRAEQPIDHAYWREEALRLLGSLFGGATAFPQGRGVWRDEERGGALIFDAPSIVYCWTPPESLTDEALATLRSFVHRMGRETRQGAVGMVIDDEYLEITDFDSEVEP
jgi:hypothetical protein